MSAGVMTKVTRDPHPRHAQKELSPQMLDMLEAMRGGAVLVTAERKTARSRTVMLAELDGEPAAVMSVRGLAKRGLIRVASRTSGSVSCLTWEASD